MRVIMKEFSGTIESAIETMTGETGIELSLFIEWKITTCYDESVNYDDMHYEYTIDIPDCSNRIGNYLIKFCDDYVDSHIKSNWQNMIAGKIPMTIE